MKQLGDLVIGRSGDLKNQQLTADARRRGEKSGLRWRLQNSWKILRFALREIFDESAYDRFLLRTNASRSVASYRAFISERDAAMVKKQRCC